MNGNWCLIESDPGVFTDLIRALHVKGTQVEEVWSLDDQTLEELKPIYGLIFLFKWQGGNDSSQIPPEADLSLDDDVYFAKQDRGLAMTNSDSIRTVHNSFARADPFITEPTRAATEDDDLFHFISYIPVNGALYELDGLSAGPVNLGPCTADNWLEKAREVIQERMARYAASEIRFNLLAVIKNRAELYHERISENESRLMEASASGDSETIMRLTEENSVLSQKIEREHEKFRRYERENSLRKHNFIPLIYKLVQIMAERGELENRIEYARQQANKRQRDRAEKKKQSEGA
ncbi:7150_t:CDS:2 [Paraglomus occultum]|uniref:ubiquitinyl hydrolase 1 n=1 Tax=Paraglomus occultum TaxID=144539 RepID=A0A9N9F0D9_9GLOM|nr:7150_t:CDS:2 [Paraglomus occultum]